MAQEQATGFRTSPEQQHLWQLSKASPGYFPYLISSKVQIEGPLQPSVLFQALQYVVNRHEILRTSFRLLPGLSAPVQMIATSPRFDSTFHDLTALTPSVQATTAERMISDLLKKKHHLSEGTLLRSILFALSNSRHILVITLPSLCGDRASLKTIVQEVISAYQFYEGSGQGEPELPEAAQYADLAQWRHELLATEEGRQQQEYWRSFKVPAEPTLLIPGARMQVDPSPFTPLASRKLLAPNRREELLEFVNQHGYDLTTVLLSAWLVMSKQLSGQTEAMVSLAFDLREQYEEIRGALGPLTHAVPIKLSLEDPLCFTDVLEVVHAALKQARDRHEYFAEELLPAYSSAICFDLEELPSAYQTASHLTFRMVELSACMNRFALQMTWLQQEQDLTLSYAYDPQVFTPEDIDGLTERYLHFLGQAVRQATNTLDTLLLISDKEWQHTVVDFNRTAHRYAQDLCIHQLFEQQAARTPDRVAIYDGDNMLTYAALQAQVLQLAGYLRSLGIGPETRVGIYMQRSAALLIAILGALKAGAAYVPLDTSYPASRLALIASDAAFPVCLTQDMLLGQLPDLPSCLVIPESTWKACKASASEQTEREVEPDNLAYILYTSGSTGQPKGVMVSHRAAANYLFWSIEQYISHDGRGAPVHSSIAFDLTLTSLFAPLLAGQGITIVAEGRGGEELARVLTEGGAFSFVKVTPAHLDLLGKRLSPVTAAHGTHLLIVGGEQLYYEQLRFWSTHAPHTRVINEYGPTETVVGCATYEATTDALAKWPVPIGRPINNAQLYVLNRSMLPLPPGVPGELYIGGEGLARGYWGAPDATAERFLPDPFSGEPGARLYRTGDRVRLLPDGNLEFIGRFDHQVKIRGFRIELAEIEATLREHPDVQDAVVVVRGEQGGEQRLLAYLVPSAGSALVEGELRQFLGNKLPEYMLPSSWITVECFPLTAHGKVDRQALPQPVEATPESEREAAVAPRSLIETVLLEIWRQVLHVQHIGLHDNFFSRGGHSILATVAISRLRDALQIDVPVRLLFEAPTIAELSRQVEALRLRQQHLHLPPLLRRADSDVAPLTYAQERLWHLYQLDPQSPRWNNSLSFRITGALHEEALKQSLQAMVERHDILCTVFTLIDEQPMQRVVEPASLAYTSLDLLHLPPEEREGRFQQLLEQERQLPVSLQHGPLLRVTLIRTDEQVYNLLIVTHHIVYDGWSRGILYRELAALYAAFVSGREIALPEIAVRYADFACWQRQWLQGEILKAQLDYWRKQLDGAPDLLHLPWDRPRPAIQTFQTARQQFALSSSLSLALKELSNREGVTVFMTLMASFKALLYRYSGQEDMVVAFPVANRDRTELEAVFGLFADVLLLRTRFSGKISFRELLRLVQTEFIGAYSNHDVPFMKIFEALDIKRHPSYNPLFQVLFEFLLMPEHTLTLQNLSVTPLTMENRLLDLDLYLSMWEEADGFCGLLAYNTDLFTSQTINRLLRHFEVLLHSIVEKPEAAISELRLLTPEEEKRLREGLVRQKILSQMKKSLISQSTEKEC